MTPFSFQGEENYRAGDSLLQGDSEPVWDCNPVTWFPDLTLEFQGEEAADAQCGVASRTQNSGPYTTAKSNCLMYNINAQMGALWGRGGLTIVSQYKKNVQMQSKMRSGQDLWSGNCKVLMKEIKDQKERRHHAD